MKINTRIPLVVFLTVLCLALSSFAQNAKTVTKGPIVIPAEKHDTGPLLREIAPLLPELGRGTQHEVPNRDNPRNPWKKRPQVPDLVLQTAENSPTLQTPNFSLEFEGIDDANGFCNCEPPDNDGAPGTTQYVQYINTGYEVWDKKGNSVLGPLAGNTFWAGFGGGCQRDDNGDPVVRFDAAAQRWVVSQFDLGPSGSGPFAECVAVSTTDDATGSYNRYRFGFSSFPDYPKMGIWPDAYYFTVNDSGVDVCAADRSSMLTGGAATMQCFQQNGSQFSMLPSDLDGPTPPPAGTPNFVMELDPSGAANIDMFKFHVDFTNPANSTFTGPTVIPVAAFTPLCPTQQRGRCVPQPTAGSDLLESLGNRLMYRLVYRNFGDHTVLLASQSVKVGTSGGGVRWYEIRNPETSPTVFQSGTFAPDSQIRWMPGIAMDSQQDIAIGFSRSGSAAGQFPALVYAGRVPSDPAGTLETEVTLLQGTGSQTGGGHRWGDYTGFAIDPVDDCTFWFTEQYQQVDGGFDWHTAIGAFSFPGCSGGTPDFSLTANPNSLSIAQGSNGTSTITVNPVSGFTGSVTLSASGLPSGVTSGFAPNPTTTTSTLTLTASATATTGTSTVTIKGVSGSLSHTTTLSLTVTQGTGGAVVTLTPTSLKWANTVLGTTGAKKTVTVANTGTATLNISSIVASGDFALVTSTKPCGSTLAVGANCKISVTFTPTQLGTRTGNVTITDNAGNSPQTVPLTGKGVAPATLTPASATYAAQTVGTTSAAKTFTLTNNQSVALTSIVISTTGDFNVSSTTCTTSLAAKTNCKISVVFKPTATGTRTGKLQAADSANNSPQVSNLTGTGK